MSDFSSLDLSGIDTQGDGALAPGKYEASIKSAAMQPTKKLSSRKHRKWLLWSTRASPIGVGVTL